MGKYDNLQNQKFNKWLVIDLVSSKTGCVAKYKVRCDCGTERVLRADAFVGGKSKSCGCSRRRNLDLAGKQFGNWLVLERLPNNKRGDTIYKCECQCLNKTILAIRAENLKNTRRSCRFCQAVNFSSKNSKRFYEEISFRKWNNIKSGAFNRDLAFEIDIEYAWDLFIKQNRRCALSGLLLVFPLSKHKSSKNNLERMREGTASLDRIDSKKGYIYDNVQWIHKDIQKMKWNYDEAYFINMCTKISKAAAMRHVVFLD